MTACCSSACCCAAPSIRFGSASRFDQGDFGTKEFGGRDLNDVSIALSGSFDFGGEPRLALGIAGNQMPVAALKRLWPVFIAPKVRDWLVEHTISGTVERIEIAANMTVAAMQPSGPPIPDDGLSIDDRRQEHGDAPGGRPAADQATPT